MSNTLGAFELELVLEPSQIPGDIKVSNIEISGRYLFVGTDEGSIIQYELIDRTSTSGQNASIRRVKELGPKCPITFIRSASALDRLLVLCDATLYVINASDLSSLSLSSSPKFKGVTACCVNENPHLDDPFSVQVCVGKKRQLAIINITEERVSVEKIREMTAPVHLVCMDGHFVCAALETHYVVYNVSTGACQDLFPIEPDSSPGMIRIAKEEFLLNAPGGLGMFVTSAGMSERPPIQWTKPVSKFISCHPYVIALTHSKDTIVVYSILDQKAKQTLQFFGGCAIGNFDGQLAIASQSSVYMIRPISVQLQIEYLLENERVEEALELAENAASQNSHDSGLESSLARARVRSAFISLKRFELQRAKELLIRGRADPREVICLFPRLLPSSSNFTRSVWALNDVADVNQVAKHDNQKLEALDQFLLEYLEYIRVAEGDHFIHRHDVNTALIKLLAKVNPDKLVVYLKTEDIVCDVEDCMRHLAKYERHHAQALLHQRQGHHDEALSIWSELVKGEKTDQTFPGMEFFINSLLHSPLETVWRFADFVMAKNEKRGVEIFLRRHEGGGEVVVEREDKIVQFLQQYKSGYLIYLEYLVNDRQSKAEYHHTQLAVTYLDFIQSEECTDLKKDLRQKFRSFVLASDLIRPKYLLSRLEGIQDDLSQEKAILYGKLGEHGKALRIFVHAMKNFAAAEDYCDQISGSNVKVKQKLLQNLLEVYLDEKLEKSERDEFLVPALGLVSRRAHEMKGSAVLQIMPEFWSLSALYPSLTKLLRSSTHKQRTCHLASSLCKAENLNTKLEHLRLVRTPVFLQETSYCVLCQKPFKNCEFARYPNGVIVHIDCVKDKNICPITGQIFTVQTLPNNNTKG